MQIYPEWGLDASNHQSPNTCSTERNHHQGTGKDTKHLTWCQNAGRLWIRTFFSYYDLLLCFSFQDLERTLHPLHTEEQVAKKQQNCTQNIKPTTQLLIELSAEHLVNIRNPALSACVEIINLSLPKHSPKNSFQKLLIRDLLFQVGDAFWYSQVRKIKQRYHTSLWEINKLPLSPWGRLSMKYFFLHKPAILTSEQSSSHQIATGLNYTDEVSPQPISTEVPVPASLALHIRSTILGQCSASNYLFSSFLPHCNSPGTGHTRGCSLQARQMISLQIWHSAPFTQSSRTDLPLQASLSGTAVSTRVDLIRLHCSEYNHLA